MYIDGRNTIGSVVKVGFESGRRRSNDREAFWNAVGADSRGAARGESKKLRHMREGRCEIPSMKMTTNAWQKLLELVRIRGPNMFAAFRRGLP